MALIPSPDEVAAAAANLFDATIRGGLADLRPMPASIIDEGPQRTVFRYRVPNEQAGAGAPVLLVPPLAAPALCFDLRRGCSLVEYLLAGGYRTYLVDYGEISFADRNLGIEHWVDEVIPEAVERVAADAGGEPVQIVGWCLGGIMSLLAVADQADLPVRSVVAIASPFDVTQVPIVAPLRPLVRATHGAIGTALYRIMGGAPAPLVKRAYQATSIDKYLTKPLALALNLHDREFLAQIEAVDNFTDHMLAYPGRTFGQLYHRFLRSNDLAGGSIVLGGRTIDLADVRVPVLSIAGRDDSIAPLHAVQRLGDLLPNAPEVVLESAPGGHLGVLTGRRARDATWPLLTDFLSAHGSGRGAEPLLRDVA